jgi:hypothetical protein
MWVVYWTLWKWNGFIHVHFDFSMTLSYLPVIHTHLTYGEWTLSQWQAVVPQIPFHWHLQNATFASSLPPCHILFPTILLHQLFFHSSSLHRAIYFLVYSSCFTVGPVGTPTVGTAAYRLILLPCFRASLVSVRRAPRTDIARDLWQRKGELWARNGRLNLAYSCDFHGNCKDFLHAAKLRHGTDDFTSSPKEGALRIFRPQNPRLNPQTLVTEASALTTIPPKPLGLPLGIVSKFIHNNLLGILLSSFLCSCPNQRNLCSLIVSVPQIHSIN